MPAKKEIANIGPKGKAVTKEKTPAKSNPDQDTRMDRLQSVLEQSRRSRQQEDVSDKPTPSPPVSLGPAGAIVDALINTSPEKLLELTDFDRNQVTLVPQVVVIDDMWDYLEQVASYHSMDSEHYFKTYKRKSPETPDTSGKFVHVLAQCRRSLGGKMKKALEDMALAELETRSDDMGGVGGHDFED